MEIYKLQLKDISEREYQRGYGNMSAARQARCDRYRNDRDKKCCIAADLTVRRVISEKTGVPEAEIEIRITPEGKPYVEIPGIHFSISHCEDRVLVVFSDGEVGADIEKCRKINPGTSRYFCSDKDLSFIFRRETDRFLPEITDPETLSRFFEVWTLKEAYVKYLGTGLSKEMKKINFSDVPKYMEHDGDFVICVVGGSVTDPAGCLIL